MTERTFVVWADPGLLTGLAWYDLENDFHNSWQYNYQDLAAQLDRLHQMADSRMVLGYEKFIDTSGGRRTSTPQHAHRAVQVIEDFARLRQVPMVKPLPSSARVLGQITYVRRLGWYKPGKGHANDASQHLLADVLRRRPMPQAVREKLFPKYTPRDTLAP